MGRRLSRKERIKKKKLKSLLRKIRKTKKYLRWKRRCLQRDVKSYPDIPQGVQCHHQIELSKLVIKYKIRTVKDAIRCKALWERSLGITLKRGEHYIWTKLNRYKYLTKGFIRLINTWLVKVEIDYLDTNKKRRPGKKEKVENPDLP